MIKPGDMCVIVDRGTWNSEYDRSLKGTLVGLTVIALDKTGNQEGRYPPYWRLSGLPVIPGLRALSEHSLSKIPPAPMTEDIDEALSV